ncbi:hypothetical protein FE257_001935 [Aspergillus nanangensis]|uniref:Uncharacterized protein n=1 Tax=Aspergillus nanangensis TaxID=2582783 RepID=A0AAD4GPB1_ASPNN|nr:hypothetical protein FE257_001935 [Aspergillus nanangensis]
MVARCVIWTCSVLSQGVLGGYISIALTKRNRQPTSPSNELSTLADESILEDKDISQASSFIDDPRISCEALASTQQSRSNATSRISHRYSGRTLFQPDWKHSSLDLNNGPGVTYPPCALTRNKSIYTQSDRDSCTVVGDDRSELRNLHCSSSDLQTSVDSLLLQTPSGRTSPTTSSLQLETSKLVSPPPKLRIPDESNIHPLFRSDSPSPPPTAMPGTIVVASPAAGQTISVQTLERVRSTHSLRSHTPRSRSPLFEMMDQTDDGMNRRPGSTEPRSCHQDFGQKTTMPNYIMAAHLRTSIARYEKRYELNESPHES